MRAHLLAQLPLAYVANAQFDFPRYGVRKKHIIPPGASLGACDGDRKLGAITRSDKLLANSHTNIAHWRDNNLGRLETAQRNRRQ